MAKKEVAKKEEKPADDNNQETEKKSGANIKRFIILALLGLVVIGISVGGTLVTIKLLSAPVVEELPADVPPVDPLPSAAIYYPLSPAIVVNFSVKGRQRFLQVEVTLMTRDNDVVSAIELHQSMIRNALLLLIGGQDYTELQSAEGKELMRQQCLQEVQRLLEQEIGKPGVEQALFTSFVMQ